jgi:hypothetical protein
VPDGYPTWDGQPECSSCTRVWYFLMRMMMRFFELRISFQIDVAVVPSHRQWSYNSSGTAFSGHAATSSFGVVLSHSPENESSLKTVDQGPSVTESS